MTDKIGHIKNPLSVIAIFASIVEVSSVLVLPHLEPDNQNIYIWFLIGFPILLVLLFFYTLNENHRVLYAPSDYKNEDNFNYFYVPATEKEKNLKIRDEVKEIERDNSSQPDAGSVKNNDAPYFSSSAIEENSKDKNQKILEKIILSEKLAINFLEKKLHIDFKTDVKFYLPLAGDNKKYLVVFDAAYFSSESSHLVEVKLISSGTIGINRFSRIVNYAEIISTQYKFMLPGTLTLHLFFVVTTESNEVVNSLNKRFCDSLSSSIVNVKIYFVTLDELVKNFNL